MAKQLDDIRHDYIRYANCWEDADVLLNALSAQEGAKIISIGSAGDNSFSLLTTKPSIVVAVDVNPVQLKVIELKKAAFKTLNYNEFLSFLGFIDSVDRRDLFEKVKTHLSDDCKMYWTINYSFIEDGLIYQGKFEKYLLTFGKKVVPLIHSKKKVDELFKEKSTEEQKSFYYNNWGNKRWKTFFKIFFSRWLMGKMGRDPAFLKEVDINVSDFILQMAEKHLCDVSCQQNYFLHYMFKGNFGNTLPHYAREENFNTIKTAIDKLVIHYGYVEQAFEQYGNNFTHFNLSNIFEYMDTDTFNNVTLNLIDNAAKDAVFAYWNLMVPRQMSSIQPTLLSRSNKAKNKSLTDKGFFYRDFIVDHKI